jgi:hypothetical protein
VGIVELVDLGIIAGMLLPIYGFILYYVLKNEQRITRVETRCRIFHGDGTPQGSDDP